MVAVQRCSTHCASTGRALVNIIPSTKRTPDTRFFRFNLHPICVLLASSLSSHNCFVSSFWTNLKKTPNTMNPSQSSRQSRIPFTLQAVFLASNRGNEVHKPPPEKVASKVFFRNWLFQRQSNSANKRNILFSLSKQDVRQEEKAVVERRRSSGSGNVSCSTSWKEILSFIHL